MLLHKVASLKHDLCVCEVPHFLLLPGQKQIIVELRDVHRDDTNG